MKRTMQLERCNVVYNVVYICNVVYNVVYICNVVYNVVYIYIYNVVYNDAMWYTSGTMQCGIQT